MSNIHFIWFLGSLLLGCLTVFGLRFKRRISAISAVLFVVLGWIIVLLDKGVILALEALFWLLWFISCLVSGTRIFVYLEQKNYRMALCSFLLLVSLLLLMKGIAGFGV